jgi:IS30 family transposase
MEFTVEQERLIWEGWRAGESFQQVGGRVGQSAHIMQYFLRVHGGIRPPASGRSKRHLTHAEREEISRGVAAGMSIRHIATTVGRPHSTVSRELARNGGRAAYRAVTADDAATVRARRPKPTRLRQRPALLAIVKTKLLLDWSPEQIAAWLRLAYPDDETMRISHEAIYRSIYYMRRRELDRGVSQHLRTRRPLRRPKRKKEGHGRGRLKNMVPITARPAEVETREVAGYWEGDLVMGKRPSAVATLVERSTRFVKVVPLPDGYKADAVRTALTAAFADVPAHLRRSLTWDRGYEMAEHERLGKDLHMDVYFCAPSSPWQRGTNENTNRLLRQYLIKGSDLRRFTPADLDTFAGRINDRPRKVLKWASSQSSYEAHRTSISASPLPSEKDPVQ